MVNDGICLFNIEKNPNDTGSSNCHLHQGIHHVGFVNTWVGVDIVVVVGGSSLFVVVRFVHVLAFSSSV